MSALSIGWSPFIPWLWLLVLGGIAAAFCLLALFTRASGALMRTAAIALILLALANPSLVQEERRPLDDVAFVVVDESRSQGIEPRPEQSRLTEQHVLEELRSLPGTEVRLVRAGESEGSGDSRGTRLFSALQSAVARVPRDQVAGAFIISDGQVHDVQEGKDVLDPGTPLHLLRTGKDDEGDRRLELVKAPNFGIVGKTVAVQALVEDLGSASASGPVMLTVRKNGRVIDRLPVTPGSVEDVELELDRRGSSVVELEVNAANRELTLENNRSAFVIHGVRDRLRVLLVSGEPHAGERVWRDILKSDPSVDLVHFTILRPPEKQDGTPIRELSLIAFPTRELFEVKLDEFDLIIFDRYRRRGVLPGIYLDNIAEFVEGGGALLEAVGPTFATPLSLFRTPLGRILPAEPSGRIYEQGYHPQVTTLGERHPVTAALTGVEAGETPEWGRWFRHVDGGHRSGTVVMEGVEDQPLLILDRVGEGRVAQLMSDHMWLWARGYEGGGPHAELLRRIAHWLMKEPDLEEEDLRASVVDRTLKIERQSLSESLPELQVTMPSGETRQLELEDTGPGRSRASMEIEEPGLYRVGDGEKSVLAAAGVPDPLELKDVRATDEKLGSLVAESGGGVFPIGNAEDLPDIRKVRPGRDAEGRGWLGILDRDSYVVTGSSELPLLPALLGLILLLGAMLAAWYREGK